MMMIDTPQTIKISGYASLFGQRDMSGDIIRPGAFSASLLAQAGRKFPMLFGHETRQPVGVWDRVLEDGTGLFVQGRLLPGRKRAAEVARWVSEGAVTGLSIGYQARRHRRSAEGRELFEIDLFEISLVAFPMLRDARVTDIDIVKET